MYILWTIIIGFIVGLLARMVMPGKDPAGFLLTTFLGIVGALVGSFVGKGLGFYNGSDSPGLLMSVFGALLVLVVYNKFGRSSSTAVRS